DRFWPPFLFYERKRQIETTNQPMNSYPNLSACYQRLLFTFVTFSVTCPLRAQPAAPTPTRAQVTAENWDKGGAVSRWAYLHVSEVSPTAIIRRGRSIVDLPQQLRPEIGALKLSPPGEPEETLEQFVNNGAVDGCIVLHAGKIVFEKYPTIHSDDLHLAMSVGKAFVATALALLEDEGK